MRDDALTRAASVGPQAAARERAGSGRLARMAAAKKAPGKVNAAYLEAQASVVRAALPAHRADEVFMLAAEAGYLTAIADGNDDEDEKKALAESLETLSKGVVIQWETDTFIEQSAERIGAEGHDARCTAIGKRLKELGSAEAAILIGAIVAYASNGIEKSEAVMLEKIGKAAGLERNQVAAIVKKARA
jgi:tellurite resistance protein